MIPALVTILGGGFDPTQIANLQLRLNARATPTITEAGGDVSAWADLSAALNVVTQGTGVRQPVVSAINGNPSILFDGDGTAANADLLRRTTPTITSPPATIACVFTPTSVAPGQGSILRFRDGFDIVFEVRRQGASLENVENFGPSANIMSIGSVLAANQTRWMIARWRNGSDGVSDMLTDIGNTDTVTASDPINSSIDDLNIGANANGAVAFAGHIHEIFYYNSFASDAERAQLGDYLTSEWTLS